MRQMENNFYKHVERLVCELSPLVSRSIYSEEDLRQTVYLYGLKCEKNYDPSKGDFYNYLSNSIRNHLKGLESASVIDSNIPAKNIEDVLEYIPWEHLTQPETDVLSNYLYGYSFYETSQTMNLSINQVQRIFDEIVLKIQEANE